MKTLDISGFGREYEDACQVMLTNGLAWLVDNYEPNKLKYGSYENVFGLLIAENDFSKEFDKAVCGNVGPTGAMHHAVVHNIYIIIKHGYDRWLSANESHQVDREDPVREKAVERLTEMRALMNVVDEGP